MSGVESTPCCCKENRPCCISITYEAAECLCLEKDPECPDSRPCPVPPPIPTIQTRRVECTGSDAECQQRALELCSTFPNVISCSGTYYSNLTCAEIADAECDPIPFKICKTYTCGWCEPIVTGCYVDYGTDPCPPPPTCTPDPCCDVEPPNLCCCIDQATGTRQVVPCPDPIPPGTACFPISNPADCFDCGVFYTPIPGSSNCCSGGSCVAAWDIGPNCSYRPGCQFPVNPPPVIPYCACACWPCQYCSTDTGQIEACIQAAIAAGHNPDGVCFCPSIITGLCGPNCSSPNPLLASSQSEAGSPVGTLESGLILNAESKPAVNTLFLLGYGTFNL